MIMLVALAWSRFASVADARGINMRTYDELDRMSDVIVIAKPVSTQVTAGPITTLKKGSVWIFLSSGYPRNLRLLSF